MMVPRKTKLIIKKWLSAGFLTVMIFSMMPQSIRKIIEKDVFADTLKNPRIDTLLKIAKALDLNEQEFAELCGYRKDDKNGI